MKKIRDWILKTFQMRALSLQVVEEDPDHIEVVGEEWVSIFSFYIFFLSLVFKQGNARKIQDNFVDSIKKNALYVTL